MTPLAPRLVAIPRALLDGPVGRSQVGRAIAADRRWLLPIFLVGYVLYVTWTWEFPNWQGIPFPPVWAAAALGGLLAWDRAGRRLEPIPVAAILALAAMVLTDLTAFWTQPLRDLGLYLKAGDAWLAGAPVYATVPLTRPPDDLTNYPFLYPPVTVPLFAALASLPFPLVAVGWVAGSIAAVLAGCRWIGLSWRWSVLMLAWPPVVQGIHVGNVAPPMFALFAAAIARPALLAIPPVFKIYSGIATLWLLRREHWRDLVVGGALVVGACLATLPLTGLDLWFRWLEGLQVYQVSQRLLPNNLYGFGLGRYVPLVALAVLAVVLIVLAARARDRREQLARLGVATVAASPSLFSHGFLVALPAMVRLDTAWFWLAFGLTACAPGTAWFLVLVLTVVSWFRPEIRKGQADDPWHPLGAASEPWPDPQHGHARAQGTV